VEYIAIDFETANSKLTSPCSLGIYGVENGEVILEKYFLINPEEEFLYSNTFIHGIRAYDVKNAPTFPQVWEEIKYLFYDVIIVAHNARFDCEVLVATLKKYNIKAPHFRIVCTVALSRILYPCEIENHKLSTISKYMKIKHDHHNALSDALICVKIVEEYKRRKEYNSIIEELEYIGYHNDEETIYPYLPATTPKVSFIKNKCFYLNGVPTIYNKGDIETIINRSKGKLVSLSSLKIDYILDLTSGVPIKSILSSLLESSIVPTILSEEEFISLYNSEDNGVYTVTLKISNASIISDYLTNLHISSNSISKIIRIVCGEKILNLNSEVNKDDVVVFSIHDKKLEKGFEGKIDIVYEDEHILLINKQRDILIHDEEKLALDDLVFNYFHENKIKGYPYHINRIDNDTTGIVLYAKHIFSENYLSHLLSTSVMKKTYLAIVHGIVKNNGFINRAIGKNRHMNNRYVVCKGGKVAKTQYSLIKSFEGKSLVKLHPLTGRTHQLRVHLASIKHPIVGDRFYYDDKNEDLMLHSYQLKFKMFNSEESKTFTCLNDLYKK